MRVALVTGGGSGIGAAAARALAAMGMAVEVADLKPPSGALPCDVSDEASVDRAFAAVAARHGRLDVLVTAAGTDLHQGLDTTSLDAWNRVLAINLTGTFLCLRAARAMMVPQRYGRIVCISSSAGRIGMSYPAYSATKAGIMGLVRSAARELAPHGVTVNAVAPGSTETALTDALWSADPARKQRLEGAIAVGRVAKADEIAGAIAYLAGENAGFVTGTELVIDGGITSILMLGARPPGR